MFKELICPTCHTHIFLKTASLRCKRCHTSYPVEHSDIAVMWQPEYEKSVSRRNRIKHELETDRKLLKRKLPGDAEFWARFGRSSYAAYMMDAKPYKTMERLLPSLGSMTILDIGCGGGNEAEWLLQLGARVVCVDISLDMILLAKKRFKNCDQKPLYYTLANAESLPFADNSFDAVIFGTALHHIPDYKQALREAARVGSVIGAVNEPSDMGVFSGILEKTGWNAEYGGLVTQRFNVGEMKRYLSSLGFDPTIKTDFTWFPLTGLDRYKDNKTFVSIYYLLLSMADLVLGHYGHNMTIMARRK